MINRQWNCKWLRIHSSVVCADRKNSAIDWTIPFRNPCTQLKVCAKKRRNAKKNNKNQIEFTSRRDKICRRKNWNYNLQADNRQLKYFNCIVNFIFLLGCLSESFCYVFVLLFLCNSLNRCASSRQSLWFLFLFRGKKVAKSCNRGSNEMYKNDFNDEQPNHVMAWCHGIYKIELFTT